MRLRESAGVMYEESDISITPTDFVNRKSSVAWDLEKVGHQGASHSGLSTQNGDLLTIDVKNCELGSSGDYALAYIVFDNLFSLRDGTIGLFDCLKVRCMCLLRSPHNKWTPSRLEGT